MVDRCEAQTKDGKPCGARPLPDERFCPWHAPALAGRRAEWSARGGKGKANEARAAKAMPAAMGSDELLATLGRAIRKVERGELQPGPANAIASLARAMTAVREATEIEQRLSELEQRAGVAGGRVA